MTKKYIILTGCMIVAACVGLWSCGSDDDGFQWDGSCTVAQDCCQGNEECDALSEWKCYEGSCFVAPWFCMENSECVSGSCDSHSCGPAGRVSGDVNPADGDADEDNGGSTEQDELVVPCEYVCCSDSDCSSTQTCVLHECIEVVQCLAGEECCADYQCWETEEDKANKVCYLKMCRPKDHLCPDEYECCVDADCNDDKLSCSNNQCVSNTIKCTLGDIGCCDNMDPGNPTCVAFGAVKSEKAIECVDTDNDGQGDDWVVIPSLEEDPDSIQCPVYHDCVTCIGWGGNNVCTELLCSYNQRCELDEADKDDPDKALAACQQVSETDPDNPPLSRRCFTDKRPGKTGLMICQDSLLLGETCARWIEPEEGGDPYPYEFGRCFPESLICNSATQDSSNACEYPSKK